MHVRADLVRDLNALGLAPGDVVMVRVIRYREKLLRGGRGEWVDIEEFDTADPVVEAAPHDHFAQLMSAYLDTAKVRQGRVGSAESVLLEAAPLHRFAVGWMEDRWG